MQALAQQHGFDQNDVITLPERYTYNYGPYRNRMIEGA